MSEKLLEDVVTSALFAIRSRQSAKQRAVTWFRIRPKGPTNLTISQIAAATGFSPADVRLADEEYRREVAEMGHLLRHFVDRADRVLEFRRVLESFDEDMDASVDLEDGAIMDAVLCEVLVFLSRRGAPLLDGQTRNELLKATRELLDFATQGGKPDVEALQHLRSNLRFALELATPQPLPAVEDAS